MNRVRKLLDIDRIHRKGIKGSGVTVAVLDTCMYMHKDLKQSMVYFHDCVKYNSRPYDDNSHGTHVCGIIAGSGKAGNGLYRGMAPEAGILPVKVLNQTGRGESEKIIEGIQWILDNKTRFNIKIANISVGTDSTCCSDEGSSLVQAVNSMWDAGITVIASAGNNGPGNNTITTPGISRKIITVGTNDIMWHMDSLGRKKGTYSGKGPTFCNISKPDIIAPGSRIVSCYYRSDSYTSKSGTSMSTPIVAGAAALVFSYNKTLTNNEFKELLCRSATDMGLDRYTQGCGMVNPAGLLLLC